MVRLTVWLALSVPVFSIVASTSRKSPSVTGEFVASIRTEKFAGPVTVTPVESLVFSLATVAVYVPESPSTVFQ